MTSANGKKRHDTLRAGLAVSHYCKMHDWKEAAKGWLELKDVAETFKQHRFKGMYIYKPTLDLAQYRTSALVDYLVFRVEYDGTATQPRHLQRYIDDALTCLKKGRTSDPSVFVLKDKQEKGQSFGLKIHNPSAEALKLALEAIRLKKGIVIRSELTELEVSVDFYAKNEFEPKRILRALGKLLRAIRLCHSVDEKRFASRRAVVRDVYGEEGKKAETRSLIRKPFDKTIPSFNLLDAEIAPLKKLASLSHCHHKPYLDATGYLGAKSGDVLFRYQLKTTDRRTHKEGEKDTLTELRPEDYRVRFEVRLKGKALVELGLKSIDDLNSFRFEHLVADHFALDMIVLPNYEKALELTDKHGKKTYPINGPLSSATPVVFKWMVEIASRTGNYGIQAFLASKKTGTNEKGSLWYPLKKRRGKNGVNCRWREADGKMRDALKELSKRW